ncbi:hypothetical protein MBLNU459_g2399t1 [Dothideomycetes sp. NU459]
MVISPSGRGHYMGPSSTTILGRRLRDMVGWDQNVALDIDRDYSTYNLNAIRVRRPSVAEQARLPPYLFAQRLFAAQKSYIGTIFAFVQMDEFEKHLIQAYKSLPDVSNTEDCLGYCQVLVILAFGQLYSVNQWNSFDGPPGFEYFTEALRYLPDLHEEGSALFVSVLCLIGYFMQNLNRRDAAFLYVGTALRMSISLALHQEVPDTNLDQRAQEYRRRLWWSVYSLDRILCVKSGNPITIHDEDINVAMPSRLPEEEEYCAAICLRHYTELSQILGRIMTDVYRKTQKSGKSLITSVQHIMTSLASWHSGLPHELRFDPAKLALSRESVSTFLHYHMCINMAARPLLFHVVQKRLEQGRLDLDVDWKQNLSPTSVAIIQMCISAARDTTTMMYFAAQKDLVATYGYMDNEHIFSAALVLVMMCVAFPGDDDNTASMNTALDILRGMSERSNNHMGARYRLLTDLRSRFARPPLPVAVAGAQAAAAAAAAQAQQPGATVMFPLVDNAALGDVFDYDTNMNDGELWQEVYGNFDFNPVDDFTQWTEAAYGNAAAQM